MKGQGHAVSSILGTGGKESCPHIQFIFKNNIEAATFVYYQS